MCFSLPQSKALQVDTSANFSVWQWLRHCENLQSVSVQIRGNPKVNLHLNSWIATLCFCKARNDGETLSFWAFCKKAKNPKNLRHALNLWILRFLAKAQYDNVKNFWIYLAIAQYDKAKSVRYDKTSQYDKVLRCFV